MKIKDINDLLIDENEENEDYSSEYEAFPTFDSLSGEFDEIDENENYVDYLEKNAHLVFRDGIYQLEFPYIKDANDLLYEKFNN